MLTVVCLLMATGAASANTEAPATDWKASLIGEFTTIVADVMIVLLAIIGIAMGIFGLQFAVRKAIKFFKSSTN